MTPQPLISSRLTAMDLALSYGAPEGGVSYCRLSSIDQLNVKRLSDRSLRQPKDLSHLQPPLSASTYVPYPQSQQQSLEKHIWGQNHHQNHHQNQNQNQSQDQRQNRYC